MDEKWGPVRPVPTIPPQLMRIPVSKRVKLALQASIRPACGMGMLAHGLVFIRLAQPNRESMVFMATNK